MAAIVPIRPLAWDPPYATGAALEKTKRQEKKKNDHLKKKVFPEHTMQNNPPSPFPTFILTSALTTPDELHIYLCHFPAT